MLVRKGSLGPSDLEVQDNYGSTPLHFASVRNSVENVNLLLSCGSNPCISNNDAKKPSQVTSDESIKNSLAVIEAKIVEASLKAKSASNSQSKKSTSTKSKKKTTKPKGTTVSNNSLDRTKKQGQKGFVVASNR
jgi:ankyrin repeat protein